MKTTTMTSPDDLRQQMVKVITETGALRSERVASAMGAVPRHQFLPDVSTEEAYADQSVTTKPGNDGGRPLSCASMPTVVAMMLEQLDVQPGHRVLEIGAGTGYNAALLAELAGPTGQVTTVDIYPDVTERARRALDTNGYEHVRVITGDGSLGDPERAPYDRIIVTVGPWDLPSAWFDQLAPGGRLVVPLSWRGQTRSIAFVRRHTHLRSDSVQLCGFIPMVGNGGEISGHIDANAQVSLYWDRDQNIEPAALSNALHQPKNETWSGVTVGSNEPFDGIWLRLTATEPGTCRIAADRSAIDTGLCTPAIGSRSPALVEGSSVAYFTMRRLNNTADPTWELGAISHGEQGRELAHRLCDQIHAWNTDRAAQPVITAYPANTPASQTPTGRIVDKENTKLLIRF